VHETKNDIKFGLEKEPLSRYGVSPDSDRYSDAVNDVVRNIDMIAVFGLFPFCYFIDFFCFSQ